MPPIVQIQVQRAVGDCCITSLSMYLQLPYEDVLAAAVKTTSNAKIHKVGLFTKQMKDTAKRLGVTLRLRRGFDLDTDEGVLALDSPKHEQHAVLLKAGLIFDGDGTAWEPETFTAHYKYRPISLLVRAEE